MTVKLGTVQTFADVKPDKAQALKVLEEAAEVFGAWQQWEDADSDMKDDYTDLLNECADVIQATCNLLAAYEVKDFTGIIEMCRKRNAERGRM